MQKKKNFFYILESLKKKKVLLRRIKNVLNEKDALIISNYFIQPKD